MGCLSLWSLPEVRCYQWGKSNGLAVYRDQNDLEDRHCSNHENAKGKMMQTALQIPMETLGTSGFMGIFSPYPGVGLEDQSSLHGFREDGIIAWIAAARCRGSFNCHKLSVHRSHGDTDLYDPDRLPRSCDDAIGPVRTILINTGIFRVYGTRSVAVPRGGSAHRYPP